MPETDKLLQRCRPEKYIFHCKQLHVWHDSVMFCVLVGVVEPEHEWSRYGDD